MVTPRPPSRPTDRPLRLLALLNIRSGEGRAVLMVMLYTILAFTASTLFYTVAYTLFLDKYDAKRLPYMYIGVSVCVPLITSLYLKLGERVPLSRLLMASLSLGVLSIAAYWFGLSLTDTSWLVFSLPLWNGVLDVLLSMGFWNLVGQLFDLQQGKRLFGLLSAGQPIGTILTGFLVPLLVPVIGTLHLLVLSVGVGVGALTILLAITRTFRTILDRHSGETTSEAAEPKAAQVNRTLLANPYVRLIFIVQIAFAMGVYFVDNIFYMRVESRFPDQTQLAAFLGVFNGVLGGVGLLNQMFVAGWVLRRFGVRAGIVLTPLAISVGIALFAILGVLSPTTFVLFWLVALTNIARQVLDASDDTVANLLYQVLPGVQRIRLQTLIDGIVYPGSIGLAGLTLLYLTNGLRWDSLQLAWLALPVLAVWMGIGNRLARAYPQQVQQALRQRIVQGQGNLQLDRAALSALQQHLAGSHAGAALYALDMLEQANPQEWVQHLPTMLTHPSPEVRKAVLARLERTALAGARPSGAFAAVRQCFENDPDREVRQIALQALAALSGPEQHETLYPYLTIDDKNLKRSVMIGLLRGGELEGLLAAAEALTQLANSAQAADRAFAAQVLGESGLTSFYRPLLKLLRDPEVSAQQAALIAAGQLRHARLWPTVIEHLRAPATRSHAQGALVAGGEGAHNDLRQALAQLGDPADDDPATRRYRIELIRVCGRMRGSQSRPHSMIDPLLEQLAIPDMQIRDHVLNSLRLCGFRADPTWRARVEAWIEEELAQATWNLAALADLERAGYPLSLRALAQELAARRARLFVWLSFLYEPKAVLNARDLLGFGPYSPRNIPDDQRAYALETIIVLVNGRFKDRLVMLLEDVAPAKILARLSEAHPQTRCTPDDRLYQIISAPPLLIYAWTQCVAIHEIGAQRAEWPAHLQAALNTALTSPVPLVRETAQAHFSLGRKDMLLTVEKVLILKTVDIFAGTPDEILVDIATLLKEVAVEADTMIFEKGQRGDSMYIIVEGEIEARDGDQVFSHMGERQVFGEMALLDGEPRTASCRASQDTRLLRLDQEPFYELMDDRIEIARGVIHVLLQRLRQRTVDVNVLRAQLKTLAASAP